MVFHSPVIVGDEVSIYGRIVHVGRTSMRIEIEAWRRERASEAANIVTSAVFTFVAIDTARRPRPVPPETLTA
jgi:acyl-CoA thioesterase YciA